MSPRLKRNIDFGSSFTAYLFAFTISLPFRISLYGYALFLLVWLVERFVNIPIVKPKFNFLATILILIFAVSVVSSFYSNDSRAASSLIERRISFIVFSFIFIFGYTKEINIISLIRSYVYGVIFSIIIIIIIICYQVLFDEIQMARLLTDPISLILKAVNGYKHKIYFSANICLSGILLLYLSFTLENISQKILSVIVSFLLFSFVFLIEARGMLITYLFIGFLALVTFPSKKRERWYLKGILVSCLIVFIFLIVTYVPRLKAFAGGESGKIEIVESNIRLSIWSESWDLIKQNPITGYGIGDAKSTINNRLINLGFDKARFSEYNAHNQYMEFWLESGVIQFLLFLLLIFGPLFLFKKVPIKHKIFLFSLWGITFMYESFLNRIDGVLTFLFSYWLLFHFEKTDNELMSEKKNVFVGLKILILLLFMSISILLLFKSGFFKYDSKIANTFATHNALLIPYDSLSVYEGTKPPCGAEGYLLNSITEASSWGGNAYSYSCIGNDVFRKGDSIIASVYCLVSKDFDGEWVKLQAEGSATSSASHYYDLSQKGIWQKLTINPNCSEGRVPVYLYFSKFGVENFSELSGFVMFAYPQYSIIKKEKE